MDQVQINRNIAKLKDIDLFYLDTKSDKPPIVCLHGRWGRAETWYDFIQHYGSRYRIVAPDQRGHGLSGKPASEYTAEEMAGDIAELIDHLALGAVILAGHSMGGRIAGYVAALHPRCVKALAILDKSASGPSDPSRLPPDRLPKADPVTKDWPMPFATRAEAEECIRNATESELEFRYFRNSLVETAEGCRMLFDSRAIVANIARDVNWFHLLPRIECPVLLIRAKGSGAVTDGDFARMQSLLPDCIAREASLPDHNVYLSDKGEFYRYFDELLSRFC